MANNEISTESQNNYNRKQALILLAELKSREVNMDCHITKESIDGYCIIREKYTKKKKV